MRSDIFGAIVISVGLAVSLASAKGIPSRITIEGVNLPSPIHINDPKVVARFEVWSGPGTRSSGVEATEGFIIDWSAGIVAAPNPDLQRYTVSFFVTDLERKIERLVYVVSYVSDRTTQQGYVYLPGRDDKEYILNTTTIHRRREGNWFRAAGAWQAVVTPLIGR